MTPAEPGDWTTVRVGVTGDRAPLIAALFELGAEAIQELDREIVTHMRQPDRDAVTRALGHTDASAVVEFERTPDLDWSAEWKARIRAHRAGGIVVTPPWLADEYGESERIVIEPAMAFGTGEHETTRGVLTLMQRVVRPGDTVADLGCGSAVLAIAAARLGARRATGIELDPDAIGNAEENIRRNAVADRVSVIEGDARVLLPLIAPVRVILANIVSSVLLDLFEVMTDSASPGGAAILSGILKEERHAIVDSGVRHGWRLTDGHEEGAWCSVSLARA